MATWVRVVDMIGLLKALFAMAASLGGPCARSPQHETSLCVGWYICAMIAQIDEG
jgi:hypothetical protein